MKKIQLLFLASLLLGCQSIPGLGGATPERFVTADNKMIPENLRELKEERETPDKYVSVANFFHSGLLPGRRKLHLCYGAFLYDGPDYTGEGTSLVRTVYADSNLCQEYFEEFNYKVELDDLEPFFSAATPVNKADRPNSPPIPQKMPFIDVVPDNYIRVNYKSGPASIRFILIPDRGSMGSGKP